MNRTERAVIVWKPQPRQLEFMRRPEPEALYGGAAGGGGPVCIWQQFICKTLFCACRAPAPDPLRASAPECP